MDAFYASVEQRDHPELAAKPIVVGGRPEQRGVVAAASYVARSYGIRSAMPSSTALKLCPEVEFVPMRMARYVEVSDQINEIFQRYTPLVEPLSLDEAFLDVSGSEKLFGDAEKIGKLIKADIQRELGLTASVGVATNKFIAKIASDFQKPNGFVAIYPPYEVFLDPLPVNRLWGIGKVAAKSLRRAGIDTIGEFRNADRSVLKHCVGNATERLLQLACGQDDRPVQSHRDSVTMSRETSFTPDVTEMDELEATLLKLTEKVAAQLRKKNLAARTIGIKLRHSNFKTVTRSSTQQVPTDLTQDIWLVARNLLNNALADSFAIRLIGVQVSNLDNSGNDSDLSILSTDHERQKKIDRMLDDINQKFGDSTLHRGVK